MGTASGKLGESLGPAGQVAARRSRVAPRQPSPAGEYMIAHVVSCELEPRHCAFGLGRLPPCCLRGSRKVGKHTAISSCECSSPCAVI